MRPRRQPLEQLPEFGQLAGRDENDAVAIAQLQAVTVFRQSIGQEGHDLLEFQRLSKPLIAIAVGAAAHGMVDDQQVDGKPADGPGIAIQGTEEGRCAQRADGRQLTGRPGRAQESVGARPALGAHVAPQRSAGLAVSLGQRRTPVGIESAPMRRGEETMRAPLTRKWRSGSPPAARAPG